MSAIRKDFLRVAPNDGTGLTLHISTYGDHGVASLERDRKSLPVFSCQYAYGCDDSGLHLVRGTCKDNTFLPI